MGEKGEPANKDINQGDRTLFFDCFTAFTFKNSPHNSAEGAVFTFLSFHPVAVLSVTLTHTHGRGERGVTKHGTGLGDTPTLGPTVFHTYCK